ncbi:MAG: hypothetical protein ACKOWF_19115 [Chloroflexota bacterium]
MMDEKSPPAMPRWPAWRAAIAMAQPPLVAIGAWVVLVLALHPLAVRFLSPATEDILRYLLLGLGIPALGLWWALRLPGSARFGQSPLPAVLAAAAVATAAVVAFRLSPAAVAIALVLAVLQAVLLAAFGPEGSREARTPGMLAAGFVGWAAAICALPQIASCPSGCDAMPVPLAAVLAVALTALAVWWGCGAPDAVSPRWLALAIDLLAFVLIAVLSFRTDGLFVTPGWEGTPFAHHHWSYVVGPAMMVRDGGNLLWDTPTPYGFLNTLLLAAIPTGSVWQGLYLFSAMFGACMFGVVYLLLRGVRRGVPGQVFALLATAGLFFAIMDAGGVMQRHFYPTAGPYRFIWSFVLLGILALEARSAAGSPRQRHLLALGCVAWTVAMLWSFEGGFYASAIWLPGFIIAVLRDRSSVSGPDGQPRLSLWRFAGWLAMPAVLLGGAVAAICGWYLGRIGHLPDIRAYADYALSYEGSRVAARLGWPETAQLTGIYLPVMAAILALFATLAIIIRRLGWPRETGLLAGSAWMLWSWSSYILSRKDSFGLYMVLPAAAVAVALYLGWLARHRGVLPASAGWGLRAIVLPLMVVIPLGMLARPGLIAANIALFRQPSTWHVGNVDAGLPEIDSELASLLAAAGASPDDPVLYADRGFASIVGVWPGRPPGSPRALTPAMPSGLMSTLTPERRTVYLQRWMERQPQAGWIIQRTQDGALPYQPLDDTGPWFWEQLFRTHQPVAAYHSAHWDLLRVEPAPADQPRPALREGRWLFDDTLMVLDIPGVWASWGPAALEKRSDGTRTIGDGAILNLHTDEPRTVRFVVTGSVRRGYDLTLDGAPAGTVDPPSANRNAVDLVLPAGWSQLVFRPAAGGDPAVLSRVSEIRIESAAAGQKAAGDENQGGAADSTASKRQNPAAATPEPERPRRDRKRDAAPLASPGADVP